MSVRAVTLLNKADVAANTGSSSSGPTDRLSLTKILSHSALDSLVRSLREPDDILQLSEMPVLNHSVRLVDDEEFELPDARRKLLILSLAYFQSCSRRTHRLDQVPQSSRRSNKDVTSPLNDALLLLRTQASDHTPDADPRRTFLLLVLRRVLDEPVQVLNDLQSKLTRRTQNETGQGTAR